MPKTATKESLSAEVARLREQLAAIEEAEQAEQNAALVGKCFKYRNCYSCPQSDADYWWLYIIVTGVGEHGAMKGWSFQTDSAGKITIEPAEGFARGRLMQSGGGYIEIAPKQFWREWGTVVLGLQRRSAKANGEA